MLQGKHCNIVTNILQANKQLKGDVFLIVQQILKISLPIYE